MSMKQLLLAALTQWKSSVFLSSIFFFTQTTVNQFVIYDVNLQSLWHTGQRSSPSIRCIYCLLLWQKRSCFSSNLSNDNSYYWFWKAFLLGVTISKNYTNEYGDVSLDYTSLPHTSHYQCCLFCHRTITLLIHSYLIQSTHLTRGTAELDRSLFYHMNNT